MLTERAPAAALSGRVTRYWGFADSTPQPVPQREGPGVDAVVIFTFEEHWLIDGERRTSFVAGLHEQQVTTEHSGRSFGLQVDVNPLAARALFGVPMHELANRTVPVEEVLDGAFLVGRLAGARTWAERFALLDTTLATRLAAVGASREVTWAWGRLRTAHGRHGSGRLPTSSAGAASASSPASATSSASRRKPWRSLSGSSTRAHSPGRCRGASSPTSAVMPTSHT